MLKPLKVLFRSLVVTFYQLYSGYFLLLFYFAFGIMRTSDHIALAHFLSQNTFTVLILLIFFGTYLFLSYRFVLNELKQSYNSFLLEMVLFPVRRQWLWLLSCQFAINLPVLIYATFVIGFSPPALWYHYLLLAVFYLIAVGLPVRSYLFILNHPNEAKLTSNKRLSNIFVKFRKPVSSWFLLEMIHRKPLFLLLAKIISLSVLFLFQAWFRSDVYDWRLPALGILIAFSTGLMVVDQYHQFKSGIYWWHQIPVSTLVRIRIDFTVLLLVNILEIIYLVQSYLLSLGAYQTLILIFYGLSLMLFMNLIQYFFSADSKAMSAFLLIMVLIQFILILFKFPLEILIAGILLLVFLYRKKYYPNNTVKKTNPRGV